MTKLIKKTLFAVVAVICAFSAVTIAACTQNGETSGQSSASGNELVNDLIPAVESKYSTYAENTTTEGREQSDYFVFIMTGTSDFAYSYVNNRVAKMRSSEYFTELTEDSGNFIYLVKDGYSHNTTASNEYSL